MVLECGEVVWQNSAADRFVTTGLGAGVGSKDILHSLYDCVGDDSTEAFEKMRFEVFCNGGTASCVASFPSTDEHVSVAITAGVDPVSGSKVAVVVVCDVSNQSTDAHTHTH